MRDAVGPAVLVSSPLTLFYLAEVNFTRSDLRPFLVRGRLILPSGFPSLRAVGLIHRGGVVDDMPARRIAVSEETYKALQAEGLVCGESPAAVLERLVSGGISPTARGILTTIGQPVAKAEKPKVTKPKLTDNPQALQAIRDLWRSGVRSRAAIGREVGYPKSTVAERIRAMLAAGELSEEEGEGEESTS